jgi:hypothetical protein
MISTYWEDFIVAISSNYDFNLPGRLLDFTVSISFSAPPTPCRDVPGTSDLFSR